MKRKVTINDVAAHCHVSKSSVSRYLNKGYVSDENAIKIAKAIEELGFETNYFASRLKAKRSRLIGVIAADLCDESIARMLNGMQQGWSEHRYQGVIALSNYDLKKEKEAIQSFSQQGVDGIIMLQCNHVSELESTIAEFEIPVLYARRASSYAPFLDLDEKKAGMMMGEYLVKHDIQRISYIQHDKERGEKRKQAILAAFEQSNHTVDFETIQVDGTIESVYQAGVTLLGKQRDCILCERDEYALAVVKGCHEYHVHVPQNVNIAAFGGLSIANLTTPSITTLSYDFEAFGSNLIEEMIAIVESGEPQWNEVALEICEHESIREIA